jgi:tRNA-Thr(GGU) m(6)t(6)A37 methyltransferase TsaA
VSAGRRDPISDGLRDRATLTITPIGVARTPFSDKLSAPRQPYAASGVEGTIELASGLGFEHALEDLEGWERIWVVFWFHLNEGWKPKVLPPRSDRRRGVFSTRSPHRPNPIGLSVVRLTQIDGLTLKVTDVDLVDGTPVLDIKPYVPIADAHPAARTGWLGAMGEAEAGSAIEPAPGYDVAFTDEAETQANWLRSEHGTDLAGPMKRLLAMGPQPHPYRRIRKTADGFMLAFKDWRAHFRVEGRTVIVLSVVSGYRPKELFGGGGDEAVLAPHRAFVARFGR